MKDMDAEYILPKLEKLCGLWYFGIPFAYVTDSGKYIFGTEDESGKILNRNAVTKQVAIYLSIDKVVKEQPVKRRRGHGNSTTE